MKALQPSTLPIALLLFANGCGLAERGRIKEPTFEFYVNSQENADYVYYFLGSVTVVDPFLHLGGRIRNDAVALGTLWYETDAADATPSPNLGDYQYKQPYWCGVRIEIVGMGMPEPVVFTNNGSGGFRITVANDNKTFGPPLTDACSVYQDIDADLTPFPGSTPVETFLTFEDHQAGVFDGDALPSNLHDDVFEIMTWSIDDDGGAWNVGGQILSVTRVKPALLIDLP